MVAKNSVDGYIDPNGKDDRGKRQNETAGTGHEIVKYEYVVRVRPAEYMIIDGYNTS